MFGQVLSWGYIKVHQLGLHQGAQPQQEGFFPDFEAQIPPAAIFPVYTVFRTMTCSITYTYIVMYHICTDKHTLPHIKDIRNPHTEVSTLGWLKFTELQYIYYSHSYELQYTVMHSRIAWQLTRANYPRTKIFSKTRHMKSRFLQYSQCT